MRIVPISDTHLSHLEGEPVLADRGGEGGRGLLDSLAG
jgi:hypothetical protein